MNRPGTGSVGSLEDELVRILPQVEKPGRYIGGEWNSVRKSGDDVRLRVGLAFPDVYEIGMSYLGQKILYDLLNDRPGIAAERVFAPWPDMEAALRRERLPLVTLESKTPLQRLDILGFSLLYELNDTNVLTMLDLGGIPLFSKDRRAGDPLVLAGGPAAFNPEPLAPFIDAFLVGDGEEAFSEIAERFLELKQAGAGRERLLEELSRISGVYVPSLYDLVKPEGSRLLVPRPRNGAPARVGKRILRALPREYPERIIVPHVQAVFDRVAVEISRGCPQKCRFCQATSIYFPHRAKSPSAVIEAVVNSLKATGYEDASLSGLSVGDFPCLDQTVAALMAELSPQGVSLSLSSLRPRGLSADVVASILKVRKTGFTLVPEAGTERLRRVINKDLKDEDILSAAENVFSRGWRLLKLYFMIGLPTEAEEDLVAIERLTREILEVGRRAGNITPQIHLSVSSFIPKPHTPFQWMAMEDAVSLDDKMRFLRFRLKKYRSVKLKTHDLRTSVLEAVFSRGDRRLSGPLAGAWKLGARFDSWKDHFRFETWEQALNEAGVDHREYLSGLDLDSPLPWDIIDTGLSKAYLKREWAKAFKEEPSPPCAETACGECLGCAPELRPKVRAEESVRREPRLPMFIGTEGAETIRYRAWFAKEELARFLSHNDLANALRRAFRRAGVPILRSAGFHPKMQVSYLPALPLGMIGREECLDFRSKQVFSEEEFLIRVNNSLPAGIRFLRLARLGEGDPSLGTALERMVYSLAWDVPAVRESLAAISLDKGSASQSDERLLESIVREAEAGQKDRGAAISLDFDQRRLVLVIEAGLPAAPRPQDIIRDILGLEHPVYFMTREKVVLKAVGQIDNNA